MLQVMMRTLNFQIEPKKKILECNDIHVRHGTGYTGNKILFDVIVLSAGISPVWSYLIYVGWRFPLEILASFWHELVSTFNDVSDHTCEKFIFERTMNRLPRNCLWFNFKNDLICSFCSERPLWYSYNNKLHTNFFFKKGRGYWFSLTILLLHCWPYSIF